MPKINTRATNGSSILGAASNAPRNPHSSRLFASRNRYNGSGHIQLQLNKPQEMEQRQQAKITMEEGVWIRLSCRCVEILPACT